MNINHCSKCGENPFAEPVQKWFLISCCDQEVFSGSTDTVIRRWNIANKPAQIYSEKRRDAAIELAYKVNAADVSADFNEQFSVA